LPITRTGTLSNNASIDPDWAKNAIPPSFMAQPAFENEFENAGAEEFAGKPALPDSRPMPGKTRIWDR
jgi:hypothetical protein